MQQAGTAAQLHHPAQAHSDWQHQVERQAEAIATLQSQLNSVLQQVASQALGTDRPSPPVQATRSVADRLHSEDAATQADATCSAEIPAVAQVDASDRYQRLQSGRGTSTQGSHAGVDSSCSAVAHAEHEAGIESMPLESSQGTVADEQLKDAKLRSDADRSKTNGDGRQAAKTVQRCWFRWNDGPCRFL